MWKILSCFLNTNSYSYNYFTRWIENSCLARAKCDIIFSQSKFFFLWFSINQKFVNKFVMVVQSIALINLQSPFNKICWIASWLDGMSLKGQITEVQKNKESVGKDMDEDEEKGGNK